MTSDLDARLRQHRSGYTHTTRRIGPELCVVAHRAFPTRIVAAAEERRLKSWKNPLKAIAHLSAPA